MSARMKNLIVILKGNVSECPPVLNFIQSANDLGYNLKLICAELMPDTRQYLEENVRDLEIINLNVFAKHKNKLSRLMYWFQFRKAVWKYIDQQKGGFDALWISSADTALCLGKKLLGHTYFLNVLELYDKLPWHLKLLKNYARRAHSVIVPEYNRACIFRVWWGLNRTPYVLPNAPYRIDPMRQEDLSEKYQRLISDLNESVKGRKIILYQGLITPRRSLNGIAAAARQLGREFSFVIMGPQFDNYVEDLKAINPDIIWIPTIPAPYHLVITRMAHVGIVVYNFNNLNNIFCAPNKIWEYSYVSKPMICNDIPGLRYTVNIGNAGLCVETEEPEDVIAAIRVIDNDYEVFSKKANEFYFSNNCKGIIKKILETAEI